jgi:uroporphyrinogen-III synthase
VADSATSSTLAGKTIFVSRAAEQADDLCRKLEARGAHALRYPMIRFGPTEDSRPLDTALKNLEQFDWVIFTSQVTVRYTAERAASLGISLSKTSQSFRVAVVGPTTSAAATRAGFRVDYVAEGNRGAAFVEELSRELKGKRVLLPHSSLAMKSVVDGFERFGSQVTGVEAYRTLPPSTEEQKVMASINWGVIDAALFFSPSAVQHFVDGIGIRRVQKHHSHIAFVAVGPTTAQAVRDITGFDDVVQSKSPSVEGVIQALENHFDQRNDERINNVSSR